VSSLIPSREDEDAFAPIAATVATSRRRRPNASPDEDDKEAGCFLVANANPFFRRCC
jgi:hypothetical protein